MSARCTECGHHDKHLDVSDLGWFWRAVLTMLGCSGCQGYDYDRDMQWPCRCEARS